MLQATMKETAGVLYYVVKPAIYLASEQHAAAAAFLLADWIASKMVYSTVVLWNSGAFHNLCTMHP